MNRNTELHFGSVPRINTKRSTFDRSSSVKTTMNAGSLIPIKVYEVLPADTVKMDMSELVRMATPIYPVMDNLFMDIYWFFVPSRLLWKNHAAFWGENEDPWTQTTEYEVPHINAPTGGWKEGTIADYMGVPTKVANLEVNALPFRGYVKIWNDWFRDENLKKCAHMYDDETTRTGLNSGDYVTSAELGAEPIKVAKMHDYFTSALPSAQKGTAVNIPLGTLATGTLAESLPVMLGNVRTTDLKVAGSTTQGNSLRIVKSGNVTGTEAYGFPLIANTVSTNDNYRTIVRPVAANQSAPGTGAEIVPNNLYAGQIGTEIAIDLSNATGATINQLRMAFAIQKYYETAGRYGTRYIEYLRAIFGVTSSDARMQRAEYLGGTRIPINMDQIIQTSSTDDTSPQGNTAGFSCTIDKNHMFTKSFEEHGFLYCCVCIRTEHTYQQGLSKMWSRRKWTDFYNPIFANLSEQAVLNKEIYAQGNSQDDEAFGYQEAWAEYRYEPNTVTAYMRSNAEGTLDVWHYADNYASRPTLSGEWINEPVENIDRTIAVTSQLMHQFIADFFFKTSWTRPMPVYSVPKLVG